MSLRSIRFRKICHGGSVSQNNTKPSVPHMFVLHTFPFVASSAHRLAEHSLWLPVSLFIYHTTVWSSRKRTLQWSRDWLFKTPSPTVRPQDETQLKLGTGRGEANSGTYSTVLIMTTWGNSQMEWLLLSDSYRRAKGCWSLNRANKTTLNCSASFFSSQLQPDQMVAARRQQMQSINP